MAGETYYFMFSCILVIIGGFGLLNLLLLRKGRTVFGVTLKTGTLEYKRGVDLASLRNVSAVAAFTLASIANLVYSISKALGTAGISPGLLVFILCFLLLICAFIFPFARKYARDVYEMGATNKQK
jgi:hypothetical protein